MKILNVAWKDILLVLRDRSGLLLMLAAPLALTLVVAFAFGGLGGGGGSTGGITQIPVAIVNHDSGQFSSYVVRAFQSDQLTDLVAPVELTDEEAAKKAVDKDQYAAAVIIPADFSDGILPPGLQEGDLSNLQQRRQAVVTVYASPLSPIRAGVIRSIVDTILADLTTGVSSVQVGFGQLVQSGRVDPNQVQALAESQGQDIVQQSLNTELVTLNSRIESQPAAEEGFNFLKYMAPSTAILYLTFTMTAAGRSLLAEREQGTLPRMLISPSPRSHVLGGKMLGVFLTGLLQMTVVIVVGSFLFGIRWGPAPAVALMTLAVVAAASGWGIAIAAFARTPGEANAVGTAVNLIFAVLAGNFIPRMQYPLFMQKLSLITPNAWGIDGYYSLIYGGTLNSVLPGILVLFGMAVVLFSAAIFAFRRQYA